MKTTKKTKLTPSRKAAVILRVLLAAAERNGMTIDDSKLCHEAITNCWHKVGPKRCESEMREVNSHIREILDASTIDFDARCLGESLGN